MPSGYWFWPRISTIRYLPEANPFGMRTESDSAAADPSSVKELPLPASGSNLILSPAANPLP